ALYPESEAISSTEDFLSDRRASPAKDTLEELDLSFLQASSGGAGQKLEGQLQAEADALQHDLVVANRLKSQLGKMQDKDPKKASVRQKLADLRKKREERKSHLDALLSEATAANKSPKAARKLQSPEEAASLKKLTDTITRSRARLEEIFRHM
ncbi:hypothetical protein CSUI_004713, partial [Cystoisospora suis]